MQTIIEYQAPLTLCFQSTVKIMFISQSPTALDRSLGILESVVLLTTQNSDKQTHKPSNLVEL